MKEYRCNQFYFNNKNNLMKKIVIEGRVEPSHNLSQLVKGFIDNQVNEEEPPFQQFFTPLKKNNPRRSSLTDWRKLYTKRESVGAKSSERNMNKTQRIGSAYRNEIVSRGTQFRTPDKSKRSQTNNYLTSAIVQNFYEAEIFIEKRVQTAKVKQHYQQSIEKRPASIAFSRRKMYKQEKQERSYIDPSKVRMTPDLNENREQILTKVRTEKYERVKIRRKNIIKQNDLMIQGLKNIENMTYTEGLRYAGNRL